MNSEKILQINEIFYSIQGESSRAGLPCVFVRLQGCDLRCKWCDTKYAWKFLTNKGLTFKQIIEQVTKFKCRYILFTGGEPLAQCECAELMKYFCDQGYTVSVETSGSILVDKIDNRIVKVMDLKCPSSKMVSKNLFENIDYLTIIDEVKFVISNKTDYLWSKNILEKFELNKKVSEVIFSPAFGLQDSKSLAEWILTDNLDVRMQLQLHKYIWDPEKRGV